MTPKITWKVAIRVAKTRRISATQRAELKEAACDWRTCAVGEHLGIWYNESLFDAVGPVVSEVDPVLYRLGSKFARAAERGRWAEAEQTRARIARRMTQDKKARIRRGHKSLLRKMVRACQEHGGRR